MTTARLSIALTSLTLLISGCATEPVPNSQATHVPSERLISSKYSRPTEGTGEVVVKRDVSIGGHGCSWRVFVDGAPVADLKPAEKVVLYLPAGDHMLGTKPEGAICFGPMTEAKATVKAGEPSTYRTGFGHGGEIYLQPTAF